MHIQETVAQFPVFAQSWAAKRLQRYFNLHARLPSEHEMCGVKDYLSSLTESDKIRQKLNKVSWQDAVQLQKNWHEDIARKSAKMKDFGGDSGGDTLIDCDDGYNWIELKTPEQFDFEGNAMGHCIGKGSYDNSKNRFFSLRDRSNLPHITVEFDPRANKYTQIQGQTDKPVIKSYFKYMRTFFERFGQYNGLERFANGRDFVAVKDMLYLDKDADNILEHKDIIVDDMYFGGKSYGLTIDGKIISFQEEEIPDNTAFKHVRLGQKSNIKEWKWNVVGEFDATRSKLEKIADNVKFGGNVLITGSDIKHWTVNVSGDFNASWSVLETIADYVVFEGNVYVSGAKIKHWHNKVKGNFYTVDSEMTLERHKIYGAYFGPHLFS